VDADFLSFKTALVLRSDFVYLEDQWQINDVLSLNSGLHFSQDDYLDQQQLEPRFNLDYSINDNWSLNLAAGQYSQLPNIDEMLAETGNPDLHYINSRHYVIGLENSLQAGWSWQVDLYYKQLDNVVISVTDPDSADFGKGYTNKASGFAYGLEVLIDKQLTNKWYGWLALSLSKTQRKSGYSGETRPFDYDRPLILNLVANYQLTPHWLLGFKWTIQSGLLYTPIVDVKANANNPEVLEPVYGQLNSQRLPYYHRLDIRAEYKRPSTYGYWSVFIDLLNAYNQENIEAYKFAPNGNDLDSSVPDGFGDNVPVRSKTGIPLFPSIGFEVQF
jgi:outer membrane receptor for ferrienterochelin and colicin